MSFQDMNQSYRDKIRLAGTETTNVDDPSLVVPDGATSAIA